jgi:hypothetical protein
MKVYRLGEDLAKHLAELCGDFAEAWAGRAEHILCTGASLYAPYSLLLISGGGGEGGGRGRSEGAELEGENKKGGGGE